MAGFGRREVEPVEFCESLEPLSVDHLDVVALGKDLEAAEGLDRAIDMHGGKTHRIGNVNL